MKIFKIIIILFLTSNLYGQSFKVSNTIVDSRSNEKLPFANIMLVNYSIGITSDAEGRFELILPDSLSNESIRVSYIGYETLTLSISEAIIAEEINLIPKSISLEEIVVKPTKKKSRILTINKFNKKDCKVRYYSVGKNPNVYFPTRPQEPTIEAIYFPYKNEYQNMKIKEVLLRATSYKQTPTSFNLRLYEGDENGIPSNSLIGKNLIIETTKLKETIRINLEKYQLSVPKNGIFVGFELMIIDKNMSKGYDNMGNKINFYSPYLNFTREEKEEWFWLYSKGEWTKTKQEAIHDIHNNLIYNKPAISLILME